MIAKDSMLKKGLPKETQSLCPECKKVVAARIFESEGKVLMEKTCPEHGKVTDVYWSNVGLYTKAEKFAYDGIGVSNALGIAFIAGLLNIVPYIGPLLGEVIGVVLCVILKYTTGVGLAVDIWWFALIVLGLMLGAQLVDNTIYQPLIYSTSIKAHPLEIFIVLLVAGHVGGAVGMLVAIPSYTVIRVIASRFFYNWKPVRRLIPNREKPDGEEDEETEMGRS